MWEQGGYDNAGGFMDTTQSSQTPGGGRDKKRSNNLVPVSIRNIRDADDEGLKVEGLDVGQLTVVGRILKIEHKETNTAFTIEDDSGEIEVIYWKNDDANAEDLTRYQESQDVRVIGIMKTKGQERYIIANRLADISCPEEVDAHKLEILHAALQIRKMNEKENAAIGANNFGLSNSMVSSSATPSSAALFQNPKHESVYKMVCGCQREEGISRDEVFQNLSSKMSKGDVDQALEFLSNEGHVYSTTDEDHFKTTDS